MVFTYDLAQRAFTPWGLEVKKQILEKGIRQDEIVKALRDKGFTINKAVFSQLLRGVGARDRKGEISAISELLDIPFEKNSA